MSETFDPDAWPQSSGSANPPLSNGQRGGAVPRGNNKTGLPTPVSREAASEKEGGYDPFFDDDVDFPPQNQPSFGRNDRYQDDDDEFFDSRGAAPTFDADFEPRGQQFQTDPDYDRGYDDELDPYEEFDREPKQANVGVGTKMLAIGGVIVLISVGGFLGTKLLGGSDNKNGQTPTGQENAETPPAEVVDAMNKALTAWGQFAVTGNLDIVKPYFVQDNEQFDRMRAESETIKAKPPGGDPLSMTISDPKGKHVKDSEWLVWGPVQVTRPGEKVQNFNWELRMVRQQSKDPWRVLTVRQL